VSLRNALLGLLAETPMSGYDLLKRFEHSLEPVWSVRHNQIYTELNTLLERDLIELNKTGARGRKVYSITPTGLNEVKAWLLTEPDHSMRFEPILRANFLWLLETKQQLEYLIREQEHYEKRHQWLEQQMQTLSADDTDGSSTSRRAAAEAGLQFLKTMTQWAQNERSKLELKK
jgi:DNA-binding PadR family transcriptional regulator